MEISSIQSAATVLEELSQSKQHQEGPSFAEVLQGVVEAVNQAQQEAHTAARNFAIGEAQSLHETMILLEKADITLRLLTQIRNKAVEAYKEVTRMQM